jgi:hypothetical protein
MNDQPTPSTDRLVSCALALGVVCLALMILAMIALGVGTP